MDHRSANILEDYAALIRRKGLAVPAVFFLEMYKPLSVVASEGLRFFSPFLSPFVSRERLVLFFELLNDRTNLEWLIHLIEKKGER